MAKKSASKDEHGPWSPDQTFGLLAGCPFVGFKDCAQEKCTFFIAAPPDNTNRVCMFKKMYLTTTVQMMGVQVAVAELFQKRGRPENEILAAQAAQFAVDCLDLLEGLSTHPKSGDYLSGIVSSTKEALAQKMKQFAGRDGGRAKAGAGDR